MTAPFLTDPPTVVARKARPASDFRPLVAQINAAGLMKERKGWYVGYALAVGLALIVLVAALVQLSGTWWAVLLAPVAAMITAQISFFGHDVGHHQITSHRRATRWMGLICGNVLTGLSYGWWQDKHLRHHANPNHEGQDPDVGEGIISWSEKQQAKKSGFARWFSRHQAWFFFPLLTFEGWQLKVAGLRSLRQRPRGTRLLEAGLLVGHVAVYLSALFILLNPVQALVFIAIHQAVYGLLLGCAFAPNHKGMPMPEAGSRLSHLHKQVITARDITGSWWVDFMLGGLNYQIEHHLFPSLPRPNLKLAQPIIRDYCIEMGLPFREVGVVESYRQCLQHLNQVGHSEGTVV
ncbi:MAG: fatty acid desaturase family protein [Propionibacteriaceae bacterium]